MSKSVIQHSDKNTFVTKKQQVFIDAVWEFYRESGRDRLPWRSTKVPYKVHVSEVMLQQTQVDRVIPKYLAFMHEFPTVTKLAQASLGDVLVLWQGLGYNRRAKMLHECAKEIVEVHKGTYPNEYQSLTALPGIGSYTAGAVLSFSYNIPTVMIETNIRTVYIHHFFRNKSDVSDSEILGLVERTLDIENPREWYWALMDYGSFLKKEYRNINKKSKHYTKQSKFNGSDRQIRGAIIRELTSLQKTTGAKIQEILCEYDSVRIETQLEALVKEGMVIVENKNYSLPI